MIATLAILLTCPRAKISSVPFTQPTISAVALAWAGSNPAFSNSSRAKPASSLLVWSNTSAVAAIPAPAIKAPGTVRISSGTSACGPICPPTKAAVAAPVPPAIAFAIISSIPSTIIPIIAEASPRGPDGPQMSSF